MTETAKILAIATMAWAIGWANGFDGGSSKGFKDGVNSVTPLQVNREAKGSRK